MQSININAINTQVLSIAGGAPPTKKRAISMAEVRAMDNDDAAIKATFEVTSFSPVEWLGALSKDFKQKQNLKTKLKTKQKQKQKTKQTQQNRSSLASTSMPSKRTGH